MNKKYVSLITGILALMVFIGFMGETGPKTLFGFSVSIWLYRIAWLFLTITFFSRYYKLKKLEEESV